MRVGTYINFRFLLIQVKCWSVLIRALLISILLIASEDGLSIELYLKLSVRFNDLSDGASYQLI